MTSKELAEKLRTIVETELDELDSLIEEQDEESEEEVSEEAVEAFPAPGKWSKKQELGHLIDSATNNHMRIVSAALIGGALNGGALNGGGYSGPGYAQNEWVDIHGYQELSWDDLVTFWCSYNLLIEHLLERIADDKLQVACTVGGGAPVSLGWLIEDYMVHMQHHLDRILNREEITRHPR